MYNLVYMGDVPPNDSEMCLSSFDSLSLSDDKKGGITADQRNAALFAKPVYSCCARAVRLLEGPLHGA